MATGLKYETEVTDYVRLGTASDGHQGSPVSLVDKDLYQPDMTVREHPTQVGSSEVFQLNTLGGNDTLRTPPALIDRTTAQDSFTAVPEFHANDNAFMPNVDDEGAGRAQLRAGLHRGDAIGRAPLPNQNL